jgi:exoenzyme U
MSETADRADWIRRMLGMSIPLAGMGPLKVGPPDGAIDKPDTSTATKSKSRSSKSKRVAPPDQVAYADKGIAIVHHGKTIEYTSPPPPIRELNFAGGGGKGTALFGAVEALQDGTMDSVKRVNGASVGAISSALLASGITVDELEPIVDNTGAKADTVSLITDGTMGDAKKLLWNAIKNVGSPLTGDGVREVVAVNMDETIRKRIEEYQAQYQKDKGAPNQAVDDILNRMDKKLGPTFQDMRDLSQIIDKIKDISVTGTYTTELDLSTLSGKQLKSKDKNDQGQPFIFSADTVPDMPVALAVQASAAFPMAFKPVDIDLSKYMHDDPQADGDGSAWKVRFVDGGVMNNTPTQSSVGDARPLDPMPQQRSLNFVFEGSGSAETISTGKLPTPGGFGARMQDKITDSKNWAAEYGLSVDAQEHAKDFVVVPLKFAWTKPDGKTVQVDMSGTLNGTLNFDPDKDQVAEIRKRTKEATEKQLAETKKPVTQQFASETQMLMAIPMDELGALKDGKPHYPHSGSAWKMRTAVADEIGKAKTKTWADDPQKRAAEISAFLAAMDTLAKGSKDRAAYVAREIHKAQLDIIIDHAGDKDVAQSSVGTAVGMVNEAKKVFAVTTRILKTLIYPKMRDEKPDGASITLLESAAKALREAVSWDEVKAQIQLLIHHYEGKSDKKRFIPLPGVQEHHHAEFYKDLERERVNVEKVSADG